MIKIDNLPTRAPENLDKDDIKALLPEITKKIGALARIFEAEKKRALLVIFQGMDTSGKDGLSREVFCNVSPTVVSAYSFKKPTPLEFSHDFLWRVHAQVPSKGKIRIFNRSHYEDVLIQRVHKWIDEEKVNHRFKAINDFEENITLDNNTIIIKFFLNLSRERQAEKLKERIDLRRKNWKHNPNDWEEAKLWNEYMACYEDVLNRSKIPWVVVPADQRWYRNYFVATKMLELLESFNLEYPALSN